MPFIRLDDITVHYDLDGPPDAPVVMLANSLATTVHMWDDQMEALTRFRRVLRYDMRGHGLTEMTPGAGPPLSTIARLADDAVALLDHLGIARVDLVGLSIGGMVAQRVAAAHPGRVDALVLCATGNRLGTEEIWNARLDSVRRGGTAAILAGTLDRWFTRDAHERRPELVAGFATMVGRTLPEAYIACGSAVRDADLRADDARITARTLVVCGVHDPTSSPAVGGELRDAIPGARLEVIDNAAHIFNAEQPAAFNQLLTRFLEGR